MEEHFDAIVVGAGFGGLGAALGFAERGARVCLLERLSYPGGCACTFEHGGVEYEGGATLFSGFGEGQLFRRWIRDHSLDVRFDVLDPSVELRTDEHSVFATRSREALLAQFEAMPGAPVRALRRFFDLQCRVAGALWSTLDDPRLALPLSPLRCARHLVRLPKYVPLAGLVGKPLGHVLERHELAGFTPLVTWLDAQCQITVQCGVREAEAPFALAALDYHHRGAVHVHGGIGAFARALGAAVESLGGRVRYDAPVKSVRRAGKAWCVRAAGEQLHAPRVVLNVLPQDAQRLLGLDVASLRRAGRAVADGWSAATLYRTIVPPDGADPGPRHLQLVYDERAPLLEGNHTFVSIGAHGEGVSDPRFRRVTASTHIDPRKIRGASDGGRLYVESVQERMRRTIAERAPEWADVRTEFTGSARTFRRWTGRSEGLVGGVPRRAGLRQYGALFGLRLPRGLSLAGDSVLPGQSTLAAAVGGLRRTL